MLALLLTATIATGTSGFDWQISIQDILTKDVKTYTVRSHRQWDLGPFWCSVETSETTREGTFATQSIAITCEGEHVVASTGTNCITSTDDKGKVTQVLTGAGRLSFAMSSTRPAAVLVESKCLLPKAPAPKAPRR